VLSARADALRSKTRLLAGTPDLLSLAPDDGPLVFLECPSRGESVLAAGVAVEVRTSGRARFADAARRLRALLGGARVDGGPGPIAVGGFAFEDEEPRCPRWRAFGALSMVVPRRAWVRRGDRVWRIDVELRGGDNREGTGRRGGDGDGRGDGSAPAAEDSGTLPPTAFAPSWPGLRAATPASTPPAGNQVDDRAMWRRRVEAALDAIDGGALSKVVLARELEAALPGDLDPRDVVRGLRERRPSCTTFWVRRGGRSFVGSSPELLARVEGDRVEAVALAGTAARCEHGDAAAARELLSSAKNAAEHEFVAAEIRDALRAVCVDLQVSERAIERLPEALHLATRFRGTLGRDLCALEVAGLLHPTSAVCGLPRHAARALIAAAEDERGWYAGGIGWVDGAGDGEFSVALRCGLLEAGRATLWAGAGIVRGSQPDAEYDETTTKMQAVLRTIAAACPPESQAADGPAIVVAGDVPERGMTHLAVERTREAARESALDRTGDAASAEAFGPADDTAHDRVMGWTHQPGRQPARRGART
jgi:isochorismate synthase